MKKIICMLAVAAVCFGCSGNGKSSAGDSVGTAAADSSQASANAAIMEFENGSYDFGTIKQGDKVTHDYKFTNAGKSPLIITNAVSTCGCTVPEYPKEPIGPGKTGLIKVVFNSAGKMGHIEKVVTITSNAVPVNTDVYLTGEIKDAQKSN